LTTDVIPETPVPLPAAEAQRMLQLQVKKHHVAMMLLHWFNAVVWLLELVTGLALISSPYFRVVPDSYIRIVEGVFNSRANLLQFHIGLGLVWIVVFLVYGIFGFETYLGREVLKKEIALDRDDLRWLAVRVLRMLGRSREPLPPQGVYNAGQKLFALTVYAMLPIVMVTGAVMAFGWFGPVVVGWAVVLHFVSVGVIVAGLMIHAYMGTVFPEEKPAFFSMVTGSVNELHVYNHHFKWWRETKIAQREWKRQRDAAFAAAGGGTAAATDVTPTRDARETTRASD
jgi:formate dehydrogenase subunit gamma